jgi:hypothetical protein
MTETYDNKLLKEYDDEVLTIDINGVAPILRKFVPEIIKWVKTDEMQEEKKVNNNVYLDKIDAKLPNFSNRFPFLLQKIADNPDDLSMLYFFIEKLEEQNDKSVEIKTKEIVDHISDVRLKQNNIKEKKI